MRTSIKNLSLINRRSIELFMMDVADGKIDPIPASDEIWKQCKKPHLTEGQRFEIRARHLDGELKKDLAEEFGVCVTTIWRICR